MIVPSFEMIEKGLIHFGIHPCEVVSYVNFTFLDHPKSAALLWLRETIFGLYVLSVSQASLEYKNKENCLTRMQKTICEHYKYSVLSMKRHCFSKDSTSAVLRHYISEYCITECCVEIQTVSYSVSLLDNLCLLKRQTSPVVLIINMCINPLFDHI